MDFLSITNRLSAIDRSEVLFYPDRCLHSQDRFSVCEQCFSICPETAISPGKPPSLDQKACKSCYACLATCPTGAYQADDDVSSLLTCAARVEAQTIELVCGLHPEPRNSDVPERPAIQVQRCLAGLGTGALTAIYALGFKQVFLRTDACSQCRWGILNQTIQNQVQTANQFLAGWTTTPFVNCLSNLQIHIERPLLNAKNPPLSRRDLFRLAGMQGRTALARAMDSTPAQKGEYLGRRRSRLLAAVGHLSEPEKPENIYLSNLNFATLEISDACTACGVCARVCPTGALQLTKDEDESVFRLYLDARKCIACEACQHVCAPGAIQFNHEPTFKQVFTEKATIIMEGELIRCQKCGVAIAKREGINRCPLCDFKRKNPFGGSFPPGFEPKSGQAK